MQVIGGEGPDPEPPDDENEEVLGGRTAYLFASGAVAAVTLDSSGANLPASQPPWVPQGSFTLGVRNVSAIDRNPEPIIRGVLSTGYYMWSPTAPVTGEGTSQ